MSDTNTGPNAKPQWFWIVCVSCSKSGLYDMTIRVYDLALRESAYNPSMWVGLVLCPDNNFQFDNAIVDTATTTEERAVTPIYAMGDWNVQYLESTTGYTTTTTISGHFASYREYTFVNHTLDCSWVVPLDSLRTWFMRENLL